MKLTVALIIRRLKACKRCSPHEDPILKRLVGDYFLLRKEHVCQMAIFNALFDIIEEYDLLLCHDKGRGFFINRDSFEEKLGWLDMLINRAASRIRQSSVKKLPGYPSPSRFNRDTP